MGAGAPLNKFTLWELKLLDTSLRNNLVNMKLGKRIIPLVSFHIDSLEDELQAGKNYRVQTSPLSNPQPKHGMYDSSDYPQVEEEVTKQLRQGVIFSFYDEEALQVAMTNAYRSSRTSLEENGASNLYMVLGVLKWFETPQSTLPRYAPLLLLPIEIIWGKRGSGYTIRTRDEEIALNITLVQMLKQYDVDLTQTLSVLPTDESGVDVKRILAIIRHEIRHKQGWNVLNESMIGLFSFNKFVMWHDIHSNADKFRQNPIVTGLVEGKLPTGIEESQTDAKEADKFSPEEYAIPIDVDSSQLEAIIDSGAGRTFILHGPPGTGKSQTITNMIANALYHGKRVLFVAEKMAALSVVQTRLASIGLDPFCLELHSNKVTKQHFLQQMEKALGVAHKHTGRDYKAEAQELFAKRRELMRYVEALHCVQPEGVSLYECINGYLSIEGESMKVDADRYGDLSQKNLAEIRHLLEHLDKVFRVLGHPADNPLRGLILKDGSQHTEQILRAELARADHLIAELNSRAYIDLSFNARLMREMQEVTDAAIALSELQKKLIARYGDRIGQIDFSSLKFDWEQALAKFALIRFFEKRSVIKCYSSICCYPLTEVDIACLISMDGEMRGQKRIYANREKDFIRLFGGDVDQAIRVLGLCRQLADSLKKIQECADFEVTSSNVGDEIARWLQSVDGLRQWWLWCEQYGELCRRNLEPVIEYILQTKRGGREAADAFVKGAYYAMANKIIHSHESLRAFNGLLFDDVIVRYRALTNEFKELSKRELYCRLASKIPSLSLAAHDSSEVGILQRNIKNGGRGTSIRRIIDQIPTLLPLLSPCMLMSPLSVAQFIDLNNEKFDLVIFDEASQMPTSEAVGAIARGKSLIVVGDPKQMPPTSFFATSTVGEDEAEIDDLESILDDCMALSMPSKHLRWHYRSKHESLIAFSNSQYYGGNLLTFPSVDDQERKVSLRFVKGVYKRRGARVNIDEAQAVVNEVIRRLSDPELQKYSIGIVSFSKVQQDKIEDILTAELAKQPDLEAIAYNSHEPIFVKNLENVQGDERDVILFSVGYGPDDTGKVLMNFGPLNQSGGERRLNVAVSRARYEMVVFTSMKSEQIDMRRTSARGVEGLKKFLEYAESGNMAVLLENKVAEHDSSVAEKIAQELQVLGYQTNLGVGRSKFKVDVAVVDPEHPEKYLLGILLDGPTYYETKTVRDREVVQPSVLEMLNWRIVRVWSLDWFERPEQVMQIIRERLRRIENSVDEESTSAGNDDVEMPPMEDVDTQNSPVCDYRFAQISAPMQVNTVDELKGHARTVFSQLRMLVMAEQPINSSLICKRVVRLWGLTRVSPGLQDFVENVLKDSGMYSEPKGQNRTWWIDKEACTSFDGYRTNSDREIDDVPMVEIKNAMRFVIDQLIAIQRDNLKRVTAQQLGYARLGANIDRALDFVVEELLLENYVVAHGDKISKA